MDTRPLAVHFGAGAIGRGFLGQLYFESGYDTLFADVDPAVIEALRTRGRYPIRIVEPVETLWIERVSAISARDGAALEDAISRAAIIGTSVGVAALPRVAVALAHALSPRLTDPAATPLDVLICENLLRAGPALRAWLREALVPELHTALDSLVGCVETSIGRMVPVMTHAQKAEDPLLVCVEAYRELPVDAQAFRGPVPTIVGLAPKTNFGAYVERKLFLHNTGHACAAYLGWLRGYAYVWEAMEDPEVEVVVREAMNETSLALHRRHGLSLSELHAHAADLRRRFASRALGDQIARVAGDPERKLGPDDRLVGALRLCLAENVLPSRVGDAVAAALRYAHPEDPGAARIQRLGPDRTLTEISGVPPNDPARTWIHPPSA